MKSAKKMTRFSRLRLLVYFDYGQKWILKAHFFERPKESNFKNRDVTHFLNLYKLNKVFGSRLTNLMTRSS